jgi:hypothetical protein
MTVRPLLLMLLPIFLTSCRPANSSNLPTTNSRKEAWFEDVLENSGVTFRHTTGHETRYWMPEVACGGVGLFDYDNDGLLDIYFVQSGSLNSTDDPARGANKLYRNLGNWKFKDVTDEASVGDTGYGMGCACGDYDGDGFTDLYVTNLESNVLYRNNRDGTFSDVTEQADLGDASWSCSCAFVDYDDDGNQDLLVANYLHWSREREQDCFSLGSQLEYCSPMNYRSPARDTLYRNQGDGTFRDVTVEAGLDRAFGNGLGVACGDFNQDGQLDFYVANDGMANQLWINQGEGRFIERAQSFGCAVNHYGLAEAGMGVAAVDADSDGDLDLFMTHLHEESNTFYLHETGMFRDATAVVGLESTSRGLTGFGLGFADFDHDGHVDLYVANGRVKKTSPFHRDDNPYAEPNQLYRGTAEGRFKEVADGGVSTPLIEASRGAAFGDLDNDGDVDIVVTNKDGWPHLLRNDAAKRGTWVMFRVRNRHGNDAVGAMIHVEAGDGKQTRLMQRGYSYCASNDPRVHFGLNDATECHVLIRWPNGKLESFGQLATRTTHELAEGSGQAVSADTPDETGSPAS